MRMRIKNTKKTKRGHNHTSYLKNGMKTYLASKMMQKVNPKTYYLGCVACALKNKKKRGLNTSPICQILMASAQINMLI